VKSHVRTGAAVLLLLSLAAFASAVSGHYDWRWGQPQLQYEDVTNNDDIKLTDRNGSRAADVQQDGSATLARVIFEEIDHSVWVLPITNGSKGTLEQPDAAAGEAPCIAFGTSTCWVDALWHKQEGHEAWHARRTSGGWDALSLGEGVSNVRLFALSYR
jgi:hypothetical protein